MAVCLESDLPVAKAETPFMPKAPTASDAILQKCLRFIICCFTNSSIYCQGMSGMGGSAMHACRL